MESGAKPEGGEGPEPGMDVHELFCHFNSLYFDNALGACILSWSDSRLARSAGMCCYLEEGGCEIRLSERLLKFRSANDLKNTLLHEMIHAFLFLTLNKKDHSYHGPRFIEKASAINCSHVIDPQRPSDGYNITSSHNFNKETDDQEDEIWNCTLDGDMVAEPVNRQPLANECTGNRRSGNTSYRLSCYQRRHKMIRSDKCINSSDKPGYKDKIRVPNDAKKTEGDKSKGSTYATRKRRSQNIEEAKAISLVKGSNTVDNGGAKKKQKSIAAQTDSNVVTAVDKQQKAIRVNKEADATNISDEQQKITSLKTQSDVLTNKIPKRPRTFISWEGNKNNHVEEEKPHKRKRRIRPAGPWFAFYGDVESDEDIEPLMNRRTERRKRERLMKLNGKPAGVSCYSQSGGSATGKEKIIYILDG